MSIKEKSHPLRMDDSADKTRFKDKTKISGKPIAHKSFFTPSGKPILKAVKQYVKDNAVPDNYIWEKAFYAPAIKAIVVPKIDKIHFSYSHVGDKWKDEWPNNYDSFMIDHLDKVFFTFTHEHLGIPFRKEYKKYHRKIVSKESHWEMKRTYTSTYDRVILLYNPKKHFYPSMIEVHDPLFMEIEDITVMKKAPMRVKISKFEYAYDCFSDDIFSCYKYLSEHLLLDGSRTYFKFEPESGENPYTTYLSNKSSKTDKGGIIYIKEKHKGMQDYLLVRVEAVFNSRFIRKYIQHGKELRLKSFIKDISFGDYLNVRWFDSQALFKYLTRYERDVQAKYDSIDFNNPGNEPLTETVNRMRSMRVRGKRIDWSSFIKPLEFPIKYIHNKA